MEAASVEGAGIGDSAVSQAGNCRRRVQVRGAASGAWMNSRPTQRSRQLYSTGSKTGLVSLLRMSDDSCLSPLAALGSSQDGY